MVIWIVNLNTRLKMKILITDIDDTLLDWTKSFDVFARKHFGYNGIALSKNPQRLWDALNTTKENIPEFMKAHNESSEFAQLEYLNDSEILNNAFDKFDKIIGLTSCGDTPIVKTLRQNNLNKLFPKLTEVIYLPFLAQKDEVLKELASQYNDAEIYMIDDNIYDVATALTLGMKAAAYNTPFHKPDEYIPVVNNMSEFFEKIVK